MKSEFPGHFSLSKTEIKDLWEHALFALDASILLNLYRYSDNTREEFLKILGLLGERLWIPHRAAYEFLENRLEVIGQQEKSYEDAIKQITEVEKTLQNPRQHPFVSSALLGRLSSVFDDAKKELGKSQTELLGRISSDPVLTRIRDVLEGKVGKPFESSKMQAICSEGEARYKKRIPPGFKDAAKGDDADVERKYGDLIIWRQIMEKAAEMRKPIILVLDDRKEDWWQKFRGKTVGPRPELTKEFADGTQQRFHMYQADQFLEHASDQLKQTVRVEAVKELKDRRKMRDEDKLVQATKISDRIAEEEKMLFQEHIILRRKIAELTEEIRQSERYRAVRHDDLAMGPTTPSAPELNAEMEAFDTRIAGLRARRDDLMRKARFIRESAMGLKARYPSDHSDSSDSDALDLL